MPCNTTVKTVPVPHKQSGVEARIRRLDEGGFKKPPVVLSKKRYCTVVNNARECKNRIAQAMVDEEHRYQEYLQREGECLVKLFVGNISRTQEEILEELRQKREAEYEKSMNENKETAKLTAQMRKERIERAYQLVENLKPGPRALFDALRESEMLRARQYYEKLNEEFELDEERQKCFDDAICPEAPVLLLTNVGVAKAEEDSKKRLEQFKADGWKFLSDRKKRLQNLKDQDMIDAIKEREALKCLAKREAKRKAELIKCKQERCLQNYKDILADKAFAKLEEQIIEKIDDRKNCVFNAAQDHLKKRVAKHVKEMRSETFRQKELRALEVHRLQQVKLRREDERIANDCARYEFEVEVDTARRQCLKDKLVKERLAIQAEERKYKEIEAKRQAEIKRFELALRFKNEEAAKLHALHINRLKNRERENLAKVLQKQYNDYKERRKDEALVMGVCPEDKYLEDDKYFFQQAAQIMADCKEKGRPLFPIARVVEAYKRQHDIERELKPDKLLVKRSQLHDYCQPGYIERAILKHAEYERKHICHQRKASDLQEIAENCLKITRLMESEPKPPPCQHICPVTCMHQNHPLPGQRSNDSFMTKCACLGKGDFVHKGMDHCKKDKPKFFDCFTRLDGSKSKNFAKQMAAFKIHYIKLSEDLYLSFEDVIESIKR